MKNYPKYMNYKTAMQYLGIKSYSTLYKFIDDGLNVAIINGVKMIDSDDLDEFVQNHKIIKGVS